MRGMGHVLCYVACASLLTGCVVEQKVPRGNAGVPVRPGSAQPTRTNINNGSRAAANAELPNGPVASPADSRSLNTSVRVEVLPVGSVTYDGSVLPLVSPDGRYLASRQGASADWDTLAATPDATVPFGSYIETYQIMLPSENSGNASVVRVEHSSDQPDGLLLGRGCNMHGFLVESPRVDGARWIGLCNWATGHIDWLVAGDAVNAHAVFTVDCKLLFTRRPIDGSVGASLVLRALDGSGTEEIVEPPAGMSFAMPMTTPDNAMLYSLLVGDSLEVVGVSRARRGGVESTDYRLGRVVSRKSMSTRSSLVYAYLAGSVGSSVVPDTEEHANVNMQFANLPLVMHTGSARLSLYEPRRAAVHAHAFRHTDRNSD